MLIKHISAEKTSILNISNKYCTLDYRDILEYRKGSGMIDEVKKRNVYRDGINYYFYYSRGFLQDMIPDFN